MQSISNSGREGKLLNCLVHSIQSPNLNPCLSKEQHDLFLSSRLSMAHIVSLKIIITSEAILVDATPPLFREDRGATK
eukprot:scaffold1365_cov163-Ochromonas_danica.AAC.77